MEQFLRDMMNSGFVIFQDNAKFVLKKMATPADPRESITDVVQPDTSRLEFDNYADALQEAKKLLGVEEMIVRDARGDTFWRGQMCYIHRGLGARIEDLGEMPSIPYSEAVQMAEQRAQEFADMDDQIQSWEVKVFPFVPE